jgi:hypothetical protein
MMFESTADQMTRAEAKQAVALDDRELEAAVAGTSGLASNEPGSDPEAQTEESTSSTRIKDRLWIWGSY